jgi:predicted component of type VI protein secretion system
VLRADRALRRAGLEPGPARLSAVTPLLRLQVAAGPDRGKSFELDQGEVLIGRPGERVNHVALSDMSISRAQGRIVRYGGGYIFENQSATNPTRVNGQSVQRAEILTGDRLEMGETVLRVTLAGASEAVA